MNDDAIIVELLDHRQRLEWLEQNVMTKTDGRKIMDVLDGLVRDVRGIRDDHVAGTAWLKRHDVDIERLKLHTGLV